MSINSDDEILQDFLIEAGEIQETLNEELLDLEQSPDDLDLLNSVFRGFHTIKGGAGFLGMDALVAVCHRAEDVFNILRKGERAVDPELMDAVLQVLDEVNRMFESINAGEEPEGAPAELLERLRLYALPQDENAAPEVAPEPEPETKPASSSATGDDDISEDEFEALLDQLHGEGKHGSAPTAAESTTAAAISNNSDITEDEFEALLDQLHGKGKHSSTTQAGSKPEEHKKSEVKEQPATPQPAAPSPKKTAAAATPAKPEKAPAKKAAASKKAAPSGETTVRVDTARLDEIMNMVGELVLVRNRLATLRADIGEGPVAVAVSNLDVVTSDLQLAVMKTRMQPVKKVFGRFPRVVRDLARTLKKEIDLEMIGEDTDLDKNLVEALADPLVHLVRNAVDHGIEQPHEREAVGKTRKGTVKLSASQEGDHIMLSITDDGKGMDPNILRMKAVEKGIMDEEAAARMDDKDCFNLIFHPGFSTKTEISDVSGRGVGMDVVKTRISQMNGTVDIDSELGTGSLITIKLPLTLAILPTLMVVLGTQPFALPLSNVVEIFNMDVSRTNTVDGQLTIRVRDRALPLFNLHDWLVKDINAPRGEGGGHVVVVSSGGVHIGLVVDYLIGQEEVVIKPLGALLQGLEGMAGATITGDGKIALILDVPGLMQKYAH
ncbi:MAG: chemotaxis protein CheA [Candidatus Polarisedimenticolaceae bacterium]|nr:chemotaxis protein CheA [Candidatus Polarisedimenticolaceae bacterium]